MFKLHKNYIELGIVSILLVGLTSYAIYTDNIAMIVAGALMLAVSLIPHLFKGIHNVHVPAFFIYFVITFIFISVFLGQFGGLYDRWHWYDAFLHLISAIAFGFIGFLLLYIYYVHNKLQLPRALILLFAFLFSMGIGGMWEIIEYGLDNFLGTNMQVGSLDDTMIDLMLDAVGGFIAVVLCSLYISRIHIPVVDSVVEAVTDEVITENETMAKDTKNEPLARATDTE